MISKYYHFVSNKLRVNTTWRYKAPLLITIPYIIVYTTGADFFTASKYILLLLVSIIGFAAYAFLLNDWADVKQDALAGKSNAVASLSIPIRVSLFAIFPLLAIAPWLVHRYSTTVYALLGVELLLFALYSFPPFRLKEKLGLDILTDTLYAHVLPAIIMALAFIDVSGESSFSVCAYLFEPILVLLAMWQFFLGLRNIIFHQQDDYEKDLLSGTRTFVTRYPKLANSITHWALALEAICFILFIATTGILGLAVASVYLVFFIRLFIKNKSKAIPHTTRGKAYVLFDEFYYKWFPLAVLAMLLTWQPGFGILAILHILLFNNAIKDAISPNR